MDWFDDPRTDEELRWGPCDCHGEDYWQISWETAFSIWDARQEAYMEDLNKEDY